MLSSALNKQLAEYVSHRHSSVQRSICTSTQTRRLCCPVPLFWVGRQSSRVSQKCQVVSNADLWLWSASKWTFPTYLQVSPSEEEDGVGHTTRTAALPVAAARAAERLGQQMHSGTSLWQEIRQEAQQEAEREPLLSSFLHATILEHGTFQESLAFVLSNRLATTTLLPTQLYDLFCDVMSAHPDVVEAAQSDIQAFHARDPACTSHTMALLYYKGFHSLQTYRMSHALWNSGKHLLAHAIQSRLSEVFAVDIHPAACIGSGIFIDHACGVVIGQTAVVGNNVTIMQDVTLGGTGKDSGDRHPKIEDNVLLGASAKVLGNIRIGKGALVAPGSLVLKPVAPNTMVAGAPAQFVGHRQSAAAQAPSNGNGSAAPI